MKHLYTFLAALLIMGTSNAQILITTPGDTVLHPSAMLEVKSQVRGFLPPRMSSQQRRAIPNPAEGLMVFDSTWQKMYVYTRSGWRPLSFDAVDSSANMSFIPPPPTGLTRIGLLGFSVSIDSNWAAAGAPDDSVGNKSKQGAVYVYRRQGTEWVNTQRLVSPDGQILDNFGFSCVVRGDWMAIGAMRADIADNIDQGAVYMYKLNGENWQFHSKLTGISASFEDWFGSSVTIFGNTLLVGASRDDISGRTDQGSAYFYELQNNAWVQTQKVFTTVGGNANDYFGMRIALQDTIAVFGCDYQSGTGLSQNAAYVYVKQPDGQWIQTARLVSPDPVDALEAFGYSVAIEGRQIFVGSNFHNTPASNKDRGAVYVFQLAANSPGTNWQFVQKLAPPDSNPGDNFGDYLGAYLSVNGGLLLASAHFEDVNGNIDQGAVYVYKRMTNGSWSLVRQITQAGYVSGDVFGFATDIMNGSILIGAPRRNGLQGVIHFTEQER